MLIHALLQEMFNCPYSNDSFAPYSEEIPASAAAIDSSLHPSSAMLSAVAKAHGVTLIGGSIPEKVTSPDEEKTKLYNTSLILGGDGEFLGKHRKVSCSFGRVHAVFHWI